MKKHLFGIILILLLSCKLAYGGKIETVLRELDEHCPGTELNRMELIQLVRSAYLNCQHGQKVTVERNCKINCLKPNYGNIVGQKQIEWDE